MTDASLDNGPSLAQQIFERCYLTGEFRLRSGRMATHYFDKYQFESDPELLTTIAQGLRDLVPDNVDLLAGLEMGGIPVVTALSRETGIPAVFVRKQAKTYGTAKLAEGPGIEDKRLIIVEDVATSGGQIKLSAKDLRDRGAIVVGALCVVDRREGAKEALAEDQISLVSLLCGPEIMSFAEASPTS